MEYFYTIEQELEEFTSSFIQKLTKYMQEVLKYGQNTVGSLFYELKYWRFRI